MKKNLNLPNALTFLRILMIPAVYITYYQLPERRWIALVIYLLASFTDFLDGYLARKWNQITSFGKLFDPLADKLIVLTVLYCLADTDYAPWWVFFLMLGKEILMVLGSLLLGALQSGSVNLTVSTSVQAEIVNVIKGFVMLFATVNLLQYFRGAKKEAAK